MEPTPSSFAVFLVLPAFNEAENLPPLLRGIREEMQRRALAYHVVAVDDGSQDSTLATLRDFATHMPIIVLHNPRNEGLGSALRQGLETAARRAAPQDVIVTMDADNSHLPEQIPALLEALERGANVVVASRYRRGAEVRGVNWLRRLLSRGASLLFLVCFPIRGVRDYTSGYRAYRAAALQRALQTYGAQLISERGFSCMVDLLIKLHVLGAQAAEVPLQLRYDQKKGPSKMPVGRTVARTVALLLKRRFGIGLPAAAGAASLAQLFLS